MQNVEFSNNSISVSIDGIIIGDIRLLDGKWVFDHIVAEQKEIYHDKCVLDQYILDEILFKIKELNGLYEKSS